MRIHTGLDRSAINHAAALAGVGFERFTLYGSRSHRHAYDVILSGSSGRRGNFGHDHEAAAWDEWGIFLGAIFDADPTAKGGDYENAEHYHWSTGYRFKDGALDHSQMHRTHKWGYGEANATGAYSVSECKCGALRRWLLNGERFADRVGAA